MRIFPVKYKALTSIAAFASLTGLSSYANASNIQFTGFGTVGYSLMIDKNDGEEFFPGDENNRPNPKKPDDSYIPAKQGRYWGIDNKGTFDRDTRFGLNMNAQITDNIFLATQFNGESAIQNSGALDYWNTRFTLMALSVNLTDNLSMRLGLFQTPLWLISEEKYIGLTYPYIRPPAEVVGITRVGDTMRGVSFAYQTYVDDFLLRFRGSYGSFNHDVQLSEDSKVITRANNVFTNFDVEYENIYVSLGLHAFQGVASEDVTVPTQTNGVIVLSDISAPTDFRGQNLGLGVRADFENFLIMGEYNGQQAYFRDAAGPAIGIKDSDYLVTGAYALFGWKLNSRWMPRFHVAQFDWKLNLGDRAVDDHFENVVLPNLPDPSFASFARGLYSEDYVRSFLGYPRKQTTFNIGVNHVYDDLGAVIIKAELEYAKGGDDAAAGMFGLKRGGDVTTFSTAIDFMFY